jgi:hypothetical protein
MTRGAGRDRERRPLATFVHATDPHLFLERSYRRGVEVDSAKRDAQERLDRAALREMLSTVGTLPDGERPDFILFTGDWGIDTSTVRIADPADTAQPAPAPAPQDTGVAGRDSAAARAALAAATGGAQQRWTAQADTTAAILNTSAVKRIYWVPGNNDIIRERADLGSLRQADEFNTLVAQRLRSGVTLQNLTGCFTGAGVCGLDVSNTRYTVVGLPTVSFKNKAKAPADTAGNGAAQAAILARTEALVGAESARGRRVLLATHIPEMDDPFVRGQQLFAGVVPSRTTLGASAWNVSDTAFAAWKRLVESSGVAAVLAGHFHDSHREVYERPYAWAESSVLRADPGKLLLAPPLSVKNQDASPIQARGFTLIRLFADSVDRRVYWMDQAGRFVEAARAGADVREAGGDAEDVDEPDALYPRWLWRVGNGLGHPAQTAIFLLGILIALLTVAALDVPEPRPAPRDPAAAPAAAAGSDAAAPAPTAGISILPGNLGRTVLGGLTGVAGVALLQDVLGTAGGSGGKAFFLCVFILYFLWFLLASAVLHGVIEAMRARVAMPPKPVALTGVNNPLGTRVWLWLRGLFSPFLVFLDTVRNVLVGRGSRQAVIWNSRFDEMQSKLVESVDVTRENLTRAVRSALGRAGYHDLQPGTDFRVNISLLGESDPEVFYVSAEERSLNRVFGASSLAYVALYSGEARWWKADYMPPRPLLRSTARLLMANRAVPGPQEPLTSVLAVTPPSGQPGPLQVVLATAPPPASLMAGTAGTVQDLLELLNRADWLGAGATPATAALDNDGYLVVTARGDGELPTVTSLTVGGVELGPFTRTPKRVVLYRNLPKLFKDAGDEMPLDRYFEVRPGSTYDAFLVLPVPPRERAGQGPLRRGGIHISFQRASYLEALWPGLDQVIDGTRFPDYELYGRLLEPELLPHDELRGALSMAVDVLGKAIQPLNDAWLREHGRHP